MTHPVTILKNIWNHYTKNFKAVIIASLPLGIAMIVSGIVSVFLPLKRFQEIVPLPPYATTTIYILVGIIYIAFCLASTISLYFSLNRLFENQKIEAVTSFKKGLSLILSVLWVSILRSLIVIAGTILLIVPGIIWSLRYMFAEQTVIFEGKRGRAALARSREITQGKLFVLLVDLISISVIIGVSIFVGVWLIAAFLNIITVLVYNLSGSVMTANIMSYANYFITLIVRWVVISLPFLTLVALYRDFKEAR